MNAELVDVLASELGRAAIDRACAALESGTSELAVLSDLRRSHDGAVAAAVLAQAKLRGKALAKFGPRACELLVLPDSLEQASRVEVSAERARRLVASGVQAIIDAGAGLGADTIAYAEAGLTVTAIEQDPVVAAALRHNVRGLDVTVVEGDALEVVAAMSDGVVFFDPARRSGGRRIFDPEDCAPPLSALVDAAERGIAVVAKMSPSLDLAAVPAGWDADWVSTQTEQGRSVVEATLWSPPLGHGVRRAKVVSRQSPTAVLSSRAEGSAAPTEGLAVPADGSAAPAAGLFVPADVQRAVACARGAVVEGGQSGSLGTYIYEPDGAVNQADLADQLAADLDAHRLEPQIAYLTGNRQVDTPFARRYEVLESLPWSKRALARAISAYDASDLVIKKRGVSIDPTALRRELLPRLRSRVGEPLTVILTPHAGTTLAVLTHAQ